MKRSGMEITSTDLLSSQVARLERERDELADLCGTVLATIRVNWDRGTLAALPTTENPEKATEVRERFIEWLEIWEARFKDLKDNLCPVGVYVGSHTPGHGRGPLDAVSNWWTHCLRR